MGQSKSRQAKWEAKLAERERRQEAAAASGVKPTPAILAAGRHSQAVSAPAPRPEPERAPEPQPELEWGRNEINFLVPPDNVLTAEGTILAAKPKTVKLDGALNAYLVNFQSRHPNRWWKFQKASEAMWRLLLAEELATVQAAQRESQRTGVPARRVPGPLERAIADELEQMKAEESGAIFDE